MAKEISIFGRDFTPSMADISLMLDSTQDSPNQDLRDLGKIAERHLFALLDAYTTYQNYSAAAKRKKEQAEIKKQIANDR